jgi:hypothetical protein
VDQERNVRAFSLSRVLLVSRHMPAPRGTPNPIWLIAIAASSFVSFQYLLTKRASDPQRIRPPPPPSIDPALDLKQQSRAL